MSETKVPVPAFRKGADAAEEAAKRRSFQRDHYFSLDDQESCILRFITDEPDWITVLQYNFVPTKPAPKDKDGKPFERWPKSMSAVCRRDPAFEGIYDDDYIGENIIDPRTKKLFKPQPRVWALACLREEVKEDGRVVGYRDKVREVEVTRKGDDGRETTETVKEKAIVIVNMAQKNFFGILAGFARRYGTMLDRDYYIKRKGDDQNTTYEIVPLDKIEGHDLRDPETAAKYVPPTPLEEIVAARASDEYYGRFFDPNWTEPEEGQSRAGGGAPAEQQSKPESDPDEDQLAALRSRIMDYDQAPAAAPEAAATGGGVKNFD